MTVTCELGVRLLGRSTWAPSTLLDLDGTHALDVYHLDDLYGIVRR